MTAPARQLSEPCGMCVYPGCVAQSVDGTHCAIHRDRLGKPCTQCKGRGHYFYHGHGIEMACQICGGTGLVDQRATAPRRRHDDDPVDKRGLIAGAGNDDAKQE